MLRTLQENEQTYVLVPEETYQQWQEMREDLYDVAAYDYAKSLNSEAFPMELFDAIDAGESGVKLFREYRGKTIAELAETSGLSSAYLSQIEHGKRDGTIKTMQAIAVALNVDLDMLV